MNTRRFSRGSLAALVAISVWVGVALSEAAQAKTINVPGGKPTIQAAIDAAVNGDVVVVSARRYVENLNFNGKAITVRSTNPNSPAVVAATIIDGNQMSSVVVFRSGETSASVLTGFTLTNGRGFREIALDTRGGAVYCREASPTLTHNNISASSADYGGGVYCYLSSPTLSNNTISANHSTVWGGGLYCAGHSSPYLANSTFSGNSAGDDGGGVYCYNYSSPTLTNNTISGNSSAASGGGVYCQYNSAPYLSGNTIRNNTAVYGGGGLECNNFSSPTLTNNVISGNLATNGYGGGVMCYDNAAPILTNNTLSGNGASKVGGGVCAAHDSSPILSNTTVTFGTMGGGVYVYADAAYPSTLTLSYCDIYGNPEGNYRNWPNQTGKNGNLSKDPLFANAAKGDFHEKSKGGRWNPVTRTWVKDTVQSPCIDKGKPASPFALEPAPNGGRINMGAYGNTAQASKSAPVAPVDGLVLTAAANSVAGGVSQITVTLTSAAAVQVSVLNLAGKEVAVLPTANLSEGVSTLLWSGRATSGTKAPAGRYLVRVTARGEDGGQRQALASLSLAR